MAGKADRPAMVNFRRPQPRAPDGLVDSGRRETAALLTQPVIRLVLHR
jgi:hypothetical protein